MSKPVQYADAAAEAVRRLNEATAIASGDLGGPADVYAVLGALAQLADRLPRTLRQLTLFLKQEVDAERIAITDGDAAGDPVSVVTDVAHALGCATDAAASFAVTIERAQRLLTWAAPAAL